MAELLLFAGVLTDDGSSLYMKRAEDDLATLSWSRTGPITPTDPSPVTSEAPTGGTVTLDRVGLAFLDFLIDLCLLLLEDEAPVVDEITAPASSRKF